MKYIKNLFTEFKEDGSFIVRETERIISVSEKAPKLGVLMVGLAGNNGSTLLGTIYAYKNNLTWDTYSGRHNTNFLGSMSQYGDIPVGFNTCGNHIYKPIKQLCDFVDVSDIVVGGWDIDSCDIYEAVKRAQVLPYNLTEQLTELKEIKSWPGIYYPKYIAKNQNDRATNTLPGDTACSKHLNTLRSDIKNFKLKHKLDRVIVMWSGNTECMVDEIQGLHDNLTGFLKAIENNDDRISPSMMYACAALQEGCIFVNCAPQNTIVPALKKLAEDKKTFTAGRDLKSGQTKLKSVLTDFLTSSGFRLRSIMSYNHLGNNDGKNLSEEPQLKSKKISKTDLIDSIVETSESLYDGYVDLPDHTVVIKYQPYVKDSKRAFDEYISEVAMGGEHTLSMYNICPDSLLALGVMIDIILFSEWCSRIRFDTDMSLENLDVLSVFFKSPLNVKTNRFFQQKELLSNLILATNGLPAFSPGAIL